MFATDPGMQVADVALLGAEESLTPFGRGGAPLVGPLRLLLMRWVWRWGRCLRRWRVISPTVRWRMGLSARSNAVARELIAAGVGPESAVAIFERGPAMVVAIMRCWLQVVFMPVAPDSPVDRVGYVLGTAGVGVVLAAADDVDQVAGLVGAGVVVVGVDLAAAVDWSSGSVGGGWVFGCAGWRWGAVGRLLPEHPAYTMFTGSTGRPKGVTVPHRRFWRRWSWITTSTGFTGRDVLVQVLDYRSTRRFWSSCGRRWWGRHRWCCWLGCIS